MAENTVKKIENLEKGIGLNILIAGLALILTWIFGGPKMDIEFNTALAFFVIFILAFFAVIISSAIYWQKHLTEEGIGSFGPFKYVRYPIYSAIAFLLNPGLAILTRSWIYFFACVLIYFSWRKFAKDEDRRLTKNMRKDYSFYRLNSSLLFPNLFSINKTGFYAFTGILVFTLTFIGLNFDSLSFRYIAWSSDEYRAPEAQNPQNSISNSSLNFASTSADNSGQNNSFTPANEINSNLPAPKNSTNNEQTGSLFKKEEATVQNKSNIIIIEKIGVKAPLVTAQSTETSQLNNALNQGVVIYPGSVAPGEIGNFFATAHSSVYPWNHTPYGKVFAKLDKLEIGDRVIVDYNGRVFTYEITKKLVLAPKDVHLFGTNEKLITLMTCWPIGTDLQRLVIEGKLVNN